MTLEDWGTDVPVSMPIPPTKKRPVVVGLGGGFGFTTGGISHHITEAEAELQRIPTFGPDGPRSRGA